MGIKTIFSTRKREHEVVIDIKEQLKNFEVKLLVFFASSNFNQENLNDLMKKNFNDASIFGCSTAGELVSGRVMKNSVVAMAFDSSIIDDVKIEVVENISDNLDLEPAFSNLEKYYGESAYFMDTKKYVGIILADGLAQREEEMMKIIGNRTSIFFVGGSAGDDLKFSKTYVYANGYAYADAALLVLMKPSTEFKIIKTQSFQYLEDYLTATKVDEKNRKVIEFDNKPAAEAYAEYLNVPVEKISDYFMTNPVAYCFGKENIYVRSPRQAINNKELTFYCGIPEGTEVHLLKATNMIQDTRQAIKAAEKEMGSIGGLINFHCILRALELEKKGLNQAYADIFKDIPTIGFSTYGEQYITHMNQTSTILAFKRKKGSKFSSFMSKFWEA